MVGRRKKKDSETSAALASRMKLRRKLSFDDVFATQDHDASSFLKGGAHSLQRLRQATALWNLPLSVAAHPARLDVKVSELVQSRNERKP